MSEDIFADRDGRGWSLNLLRSPHQILTQLKLRALWFYVRCVSLYTRRELYEPFDILSAFSGMCKLMEATIQAPFIFGLPTSHFDFSLLWQPGGQASRLDKPKQRNEVKYQGVKFPSWSWCGWESSGISYAAEMVDGCLLDLRSWLLHRTWIDWHIRDGHGTLRRVWDRSLAEEDESTSPKWKGYRDDCSDDDAASVLSGSDASIGSPLSTTSNTRDARNTIHAPQAPATTPSRPVVRLDLGEQDDCQHDAYGRPKADNKIRNITQGRAKEDFTLTLPEDPYNVRRATLYESITPDRDFPDQIFLQFFTWKASFHVVPATDDMANPVGRRVNLGAGLRRCHIMDQHGDKCGSIVVDTKWLRQKELLRDEDEPNEEAEGTQFDFIAISEAKSFTMEEFPDWTYYITKERAESEWDLFFVLLIEHFPVEGFHRRVALGKVFQAAFDFDLGKPESQWKEVILG